MTSPPCTDACPDWHEHLVEPDDLVCQHHQHQLRRRQWRALYDSDADDPGAVAAVLRADDPAASLKALKTELGGEFAAADKAGKLMAEAARGSPQAKMLLSLMPPPADASRLNRFKAAIGAGVKLAIEQRDSDMLALTALETGRPAAPKMRWAVQIPTLNHQPTRDRLRLAGHPSERKRMYRHGAYVVPGRDEAEPERTQEATGRNRRDKRAQGRRSRISASKPAGKPRGRRLR